MISEEELESLSLNWFKSCGYACAYGPDIAHDGKTPERSDYQQAVLVGRLLIALQKINLHIPLTTLEEAAQTVNKPESPVLIHNNRTFHNLPCKGCRWNTAMATRQNPTTSSSSTSTTLIETNFWWSTSLPYRGAGNCADPTWSSSSTVFR